MGYLYPIGGFISFAIPLFVCTEKDPHHDLGDTAFDDDDHTGCGVKDIFEVMNKQAEEDKKKGIIRRASESNIDAPPAKDIEEMDAPPNGNKVEQTPAINDDKVQS